MPVEVALLAPAPVPIEGQRELAEAMNPPMIAAETRGGGTTDFTEFDGTPVLTLGRARVVETQTDLRRVYQDEVTVPDDTGCWYEGVVPYSNHERGIALMMALAEISEGQAVVRGIRL
ncbi:MAG: hypothetical protein LCH36_02745 [Actinobacteria bacterium]|nr:hypothetical protein [Actinomycetota bacterium]